MGQEERREQFIKDLTVDLLANGAALRQRQSNLCFSTRGKRADKKFIAATGRGT